MSNLVRNSSKDFNKRRDFLSTLQESFVILAGEGTPASPLSGSVTDWLRWSKIFASSECSAVWERWYNDYGVAFLSRIDSNAALLENYGEAAYDQAIYILDEANQSGDREFVLDMAAEAIEWLSDRVELLRRKLVKELTLRHATVTTEWLNGWLDSPRKESRRAFVDGLVQARSIKMESMEIELAPSSEMGPFVVEA